MFRLVVVLLSITNLLLCPLACTGVLRCAGDEVATRMPTCNCGMCENSREAPADQIPPNDGPCESCQCLCGGAVSVKDSGPQIALTVGLWLGVELVDDLLAAECHARSASDYAGCPPGPSSGRLLRLELASLVC